MNISDQWGGEMWHLFWYVNKGKEFTGVENPPPSWSWIWGFVLTGTLSQKIPDPSWEPTSFLFKCITSQSLLQEKIQRKIVFLKMSGRIKEKNMASHLGCAVINCSWGIKRAVLTNAQWIVTVFQDWTYAVWQGQNMSEKHLPPSTRLLCNKETQ